MKYLINMDKILKLKEQGNTAFKASKYSDAITFYEEANIQIKFRRQDIAKTEFTDEEKRKLKKLEEELHDTQ